MSPMKHVFDLDVDPFVPNGWSVVKHRHGGKFEWHPDNVRLGLLHRQTDGDPLSGHRLRLSLACYQLLNANLLDYLLANPNLIPEGWKNKIVCFWGTIYRGPDGSLLVRFLYWDGGWYCSHRSLDEDWRGVTLAIIALPERRHTINLNDEPFIPNGWSVVEHRRGGKFEWSLDKVRLHLSPNQMNGKRLQGHDLRKELEGMVVFNANLLDYLLANPYLIPEEWKGQYIIFWGTIYRRPNDDRLCVRDLYWNWSEWYSGNSYINGSFGEERPAIIPVG